MQLDASQQNSSPPQSDPLELEARAALEAFGRLPTAAATTPPAAFAIELPEGENIDCYELAARIADAVETPCCKVEIIGPTRRAMGPSTPSDRETRLAAYRGAPYSPEWDPDFELLSPIQRRRLDERARRMQDFQKRVNRGILNVFTQAHDATVAVGVSTYMTRGSAEQYLRSCGFQAKDERPTRDRLEPSDEAPHSGDAPPALGTVGAASSTALPATRNPSSEPKRPKERPPSKQSHTASHDEAHPPLSRSPGKQPQEQPIGKRILRAGEAIARTGLGRTTLYNRMNPAHPDYDPSFPKRVAIGRRAVGFRESEIDAWISRQTEKRQ
jgi:prophage regulatory protein